MMIDGYLLGTNLAWSAGGLIVGLLFGALVRRTAGTSRNEVLRTLLGVVIVILLVGSQITYYRTTAASRAFTECYKGFFLQVAGALNERSEAQGRSNDGQIAVLERSLAGDQAGAAQAIREHVAALRALEEVRQKAPLPQPPNCEDP